jgi:hypothetical protein
MPYHVGSLTISKGDGMKYVRSLVTLALMCCSSILLAQSQAPAKFRVPPDPKSLPQIAPQKMFAPYWTAEPGWHTEIQLRNNLITGLLVVTPVLRLATGQEYVLSPVAVAASDVVSVDVADELQKKYSLVGQAGTYGSVLLRYDAVSHRNLYAAVMVHEIGQPVGFHIDAFGSDEQDFGSSHEGIWWLPRPGVKDALIISNASDKPNHGRLFVYDATGRPWQQDVPLGPRETVKFSVAELVNKAGFTGTYGGFRFQAAARSDSVDAVYFMYDETSGFSALMKMFDHDPSATVKEHLFGGNQVWTTWAPMLALQTPDPALALPEGTELQPQVLIRNTTPQVQAANVSFIWRGNTKKGNVALPPMQLKPFETVLLDVKALQQQGKIPPDAHWALVKISSPTAKPDDIMAIASSYDSTGRYGAQTPFFDQLANHWAAGAFVVDSTHNSLITITNGGTKPADAVVTFHYNNGSKDYEVARTIASGDQAWINMAELIRGQIPDAKGAKFPAELTTGSYDVRQPGGAGYPSLLENKIIVDRTYGHLAYGCALCCGYTGTSFNPDAFTGTVGSGTNDLIWAQDACDQWQDDVTSVSTSWNSDNPPVATVANAYSRLVGLGGANGSAFVSLPWGARNRCPNHGSTPTGRLSVVPRFSNAYSAYIPVDHVTGPTLCHALYTLVYMGDALRNTYRVTESINITPDKQQSSGFFPDTGQTRNYGPPSPANGNALSSADEDGVANDCHLWNASGKANPSGFAHDESYPFAHQGQSHFSGSSCNPLEPCVSITWDMRTVIDTTNPQAPTAYVNYNHTCYPAHQVKVNGQSVYTYTPPSNDPLYIAGCLSQFNNKIVGQTQPVAVPAH